MKPAIVERRLNGRRFLLPQVLRHGVEHDLRAAQRGTRWRLHLHERDALILVGKKSGRQPHEQQTDGNDHSAIDQQPTPEAIDHMAYAAYVLVATALEAAIERTEEPFFGASPPLPAGFNIVAHSAGVSDNATNTESSIAETIVSENCR